MTTLAVKSSAKNEVINVTEPLARVASERGDGLMVINARHTTVALVVCEDDEELRRDLLRLADDLLAPLRPFEHVRNDNPNAEAHLLSALAGTSLTLAVEDGKLALGKYQNILLLELDGPKERELHCTFMEAT